MKEKELTGRLPQEAEIKKKFYAAPKIEAIGAVKDVTRGGQGFNADNGTHRAGGPPSDPNYQ